ncbi:MAG: phosphoglycerate mutase [Flavobacteriaceae bacterium]|nr:MAG: phosphoglycerate mutase [Flavobacteriaceae bacterium]
MKKIALLLFFFTICSFAQENTTTYYLIRHAEKTRSEVALKNPHLNEKGLERATSWSHVFKDIKFDLIYSTNYHRTKETASPIQLNNAVEIQFYNPRDLYSSDFQKTTKNKTVLIVGHSNTTPAFANKIIGTAQYDAMDDRNNGNLYIIHIKNKQVFSQLLHIN